MRVVEGMAVVEDPVGFYLARLRRCRGLLRAAIAAGDLERAELAQRGMGAAYRACRDLGALGEARAAFREP